MWIRVVALVFCAIALMTSSATAQGGDGSLRGTVKEEQVAAMPVVTVTATSLALLSPALATTDSSGNYRIINLPPGTYTLTAEHTGFSLFRREDIVVRAGATFQVDITMSRRAP